MAFRIIDIINITPTSFDVSVDPGSPPGGFTDRWYCSTAWIGTNTSHTSIVATVDKTAYSPATVSFTGLVPGVMYFIFSERKDSGGAHVEWMSFIPPGNVWRVPCAVLPVAELAIQTIPDVDGFIYAEDWSSGLLKRWSYNDDQSSNSVELLPDDSFMGSPFVRMGDNKTGYPIDAMWCALSSHIFCDQRYPIEFAMKMRMNDLKQAFSCIVFYNEEATYGGMGMVQNYATTHPTQNLYAAWDFNAVNLAPQMDNSTIYDVRVTYDPTTTYLGARSATFKMHVDGNLVATKQRTVGVGGPTHYLPWPVNMYLASAPFNNAAYGPEDEEDYTGDGGTLDFSEPKIKAHAVKVGGLGYTGWDQDEITDGSTTHQFATDLDWRLNGLTGKINKTTGMMQASSMVSRSPILIPSGGLFDKLETVRYNDDGSMRVRVYNGNDDTLLYDTDISGWGTIQPYIGGDFNESGNLTSQPPAGQAPNIYEIDLSAITAGIDRIYRVANLTTSATTVYADNMAEPRFGMILVSFPPPDTTAPVTTIYPLPGAYSSAQSVTLTANETATILYTLDGSDPKDVLTIDEVTNTVVMDNGTPITDGVTP